MLEWRAIGFIDEFPSLQHAVLMFKCVFSVLRDVAFSKHWSSLESFEPSWLT